MTSTSPQPYNLTNQSLIYYVIGGLVGAILAGLKGTFNIMEYENAQAAAKEAERKENGFYKIDEKDETFLDKNEN